MKRESALANGRMVHIAREGNTNRTAASKQYQPIGSETLMEKSRLGEPELRGKVLIKLPRLLRWKRAEHDRGYYER